MLFVVNVETRSLIWKCSSRSKTSWSTTTTSAHHAVRRFRHQSFPWMFRKTDQKSSM